MKKIIIIVIAIIGINVFAGNIASANSINGKYQCNGEEYGKIIYPKPLNYNGVKIGQLCVYKNKVLAFHNFTTIHSKFIKKYNIKIDVSMNSTQLENEIYNKVNEANSNKLETAEFKKVSLFIDIWSGYDYNAEYKSIIDNAN